MRNISRFIVSLLLLSPVCFAAKNTNPADNWEVDGLNGTIVVNGMMLTEPCAIASESREQELDLGALSQRELEKVGDVSVPVDMHIILEHCPGGVHQLHESQDVRHNLWLADQSIASVTITGEEEPSDPRFFRLKGSTSGISLRLEDAKGEQLMPSVAEHPLALNQGRNDLMLKVQLRRNEMPITPGEWTAIVQLGMEYD
ncbi:fimbrial protein [Pantoea ananatis]|uniref:fimbrial protein n=1 Tax=Pantoea ananas TaxID=553 RepID=UPI000496715D|nr:fimbrial protein [Pantoea ananatis]